MAQEKALADLMRSNEAQVRGRGLLRHIGKSINGVKATITVTEGGLMGATHRMGARKVADYFNWVQTQSWTTKGRNVPPALAIVETRLREFETIKYR